MSSSSSTPPSIGETTIGEDGSRPRRGDDAARLRAGNSLGRYVVLGKVGSGGMGAVYAAFDPELDRKVAVKLLHPGMRRASSLGSTGRLQREAQALAKLNHPNVISVYDVGVFEDQVFVAMEFVAGGHLGEWMAKSPPFDDVLERFRAAGRGLAAAHAAGLIHRDFKPENVLLHEDGRVVVADFGLARRGSSHDEEETGRALGESQSGKSLDVRLTATGALVGTPAYMSPEQHLQRPTTARSDQFSFCVALFEAAYGRRPFEGDNLAALAVDVADGEIRFPANSRVPSWFRRVVARGLAKDPSQRYPDMEALLSDLERLPGRRRRRVTTGLGLVALVGAASATWLAFAGQPGVCDSADSAMQGVWDAERKAVVRAAFEETKLPYVTALWPKVEAALDDYTTQYVATQRDACEATRVRNEQSEQMFDLRMSCLHERRQLADQTLSVLADADPALVGKSLDLVLDLPELAACSNLEALADDVAPPATKAISEAVDAVTPALAKAEALRNAGRLKEASVVAEKAATQAAAIDYLPVRARALSIVGMIRSALDGDDAEQPLLDAVTLALEVGDDALFVETALELTGYLVKRRERFAEADLWIVLAGATLNRMGNPTELEGRWLLAKADALAEQSQFVESEAAAAAAVALYEEHAPGTRRLASAYTTMASLYYNRGELLAARDAMQNSLEVGRALYGADHPSAIGRQNNLAVIAISLGDAADGIEQMRDIVDRSRRVFGPDHLSTVDAVSNLGVALSRLERWEEAEVALREVLVAYQNRFPQGNTDVGECHVNLASVLEATNKPDEAIAQLQRALETFEKAEGRKWRYGQTLMALGRLEVDQGQVETGLARAREGLEIYVKDYGLESTRAAGVTFNVAEIEVDAGEVDAARKHLEGVMPTLARGENPGLHAEAVVLLHRIVDDDERRHELVQTFEKLMAAMPEGPKKTELTERFGAR